jgi:hypothetical protein
MGAKGRGRPQTRVKVRVEFRAQVRADVTRSHEGIGISGYHAAPAFAHRFQHL